MSVDNELSPVVSGSYDPNTVDRESIQSEKRFHAHLVGRTRKERADVTAKSVRAGDSLLSGPAGSLRMRPYCPPVGLTSTR
ncbi:hypothetical protein [Streptomyces sp. IB2014 016-6]|uniref:hypothetical protein n=1 Tax=Streptomyces sp. IB2014 016-6 TaxID=2517818 RepID=UPI001F4FCBEB|nr:hypothetical protein [Streptomyces sp. IB2014 016-6]